MFIIKTLHHTRTFVTVQRPFQKKFNVAWKCESLLQSPRKCDMFPVSQYQKNNNTWDLMYPDNIRLVHMFTAAKKQQRHEFCWNFLQFVQQQQQPATLHCLRFSNKVHFHFGGFMNKQNKRFWASKNPHRDVKISLQPTKCTMLCAISKQFFSAGLWHTNILQMSALASCMMCLVPYPVE